MIQLSLIPQIDVFTLEGEIETLNERVSEYGVSEADIRMAACAVRSRFSGWLARELVPAERKRVQAYFLAVVRRRIVTSREPSAARVRHRLVVVSIAADLCAGGWDPGKAAEEALRLTGQAS